MMEHQIDGKNVFITLYSYNTIVSISPLLAFIFEKREVILFISAKELYQ